MTAFSDFLEAAILNHFFRNTDIGAPPANVYIGLYTSATDDASGGTEVTGGSYARATVSTTSQWSAPGAGGLTDNINDIVFATATANWGTITHVAIADAITGGNRLFHGALAASKVVNSGDIFKFLAGALDITLA